MSRLRVCKKPSSWPPKAQGELEPVSSSDLSQLLPTVLSFMCCLRVRSRAWLAPVMTALGHEALVWAVTLNARSSMAAHAPLGPRERFSALFATFGQV